MNIFQERIKPLLDQSGLTDRALEEGIGLPRGIIYKWKSDKNKNYKFYIVEIAAYFHVSTDYLLGNTDDPRPAGQKEKTTPVSESGFLYPPNYDKLSPENRAIVDRLIADLVENQSTD